MNIPKKQPAIAIILPAYNEDVTIEDVIRAFHAEIPEAGIFVIDNNSSDDTAETAKRVLRELGASGAVLVEKRQGKGNAVRRAFLEVDADIYVMVDADNTYPAHQVHELIAPIAAGRADMVVGDRRSHGDYSRENKRPLHNFGNNLVQWLVRAVSGTEVTDIMSGYRAMSRQFVQCYPILIEGFQLETDMCLFAAQARMRTMETPVQYVDRPHGSISKLNTFQDGARVLICIFDMFRYFNPMLFFVICSSFFILLSLACGSVVIHEWLTTHYINHVPLALLAVALGLLGIISLATGVVLDAIRYNSRRELEMLVKERQPVRYGVEARPGQFDLVYESKHSG